MRALLFRLLARETPILAELQRQLEGRSVPLTEITLSKVSSVQSHPRDRGDEEEMNSLWRHLGIRPVIEELNLLFSSPNLPPLPPHSDEVIFLDGIATLPTGIQYTMGKPRSRLFLLDSQGESFVRSEPYLEQIEYRKITDHALSYVDGIITDSPVSFILAENLISNIPPLLDLRPHSLSPITEDIRLRIRSELFRAVESDTLLVFDLFSEADLNDFAIHERFAHGFAGALYQTRGSDVQLVFLVPKTTEKTLNRILSRPLVSDKKRIHVLHYNDVPERAQILGACDILFIQQGPREKVLFAEALGANIVPLLHAGSSIASYTNSGAPKGNWDPNGGFIVTLDTIFDSPVSYYRDKLEMIQKRLKGAVTSSVFEYLGLCGVGTTRPSRSWVWGNINSLSGSLLLGNGKKSLSDLHAFISGIGGA